MRERKKKLAVDDTELVAYVDASRRCVTDAMGQKVLYYDDKILFTFTISFVLLESPRRHIEAQDTNEG